MIEIILILLFGIWTSYTDIKYEKIKNISVLLMIIFGIILNFVIFHSGSNKEMMISNIILSIFSSVIIWLAGLWSAGDAKLFIGYSILIPPYLYNQIFDPRFPSLNIFIYTFSIIFLYLGVQVLFKTTWKEKIETVRKFFSLKFLVRLVVAFIALSTTRMLLFPDIGILHTYFVNIFLMFVIFEIIETFTKIKTDLIFIAVAVVGMLIFRDYFLSAGFILSLVQTALIFVAIRSIIVELGMQVFLRRMKISELKEGMIPAEIILKDKSGRFVKEKISYFSLFSMLKSRSKEATVLDVRTDGLTREDIKNLQALHNKRKIKDDYLLINTAMPFAIFIFIGVLISIASKIFA